MGEGEIKTTKLPNFDPFRSHMVLIRGKLIVLHHEINLKPNYTDTQSCDQSIPIFIQFNKFSIFLLNSFIFLKK
jgi:hypothetical protein